MDGNTFMGQKLMAVVFGMVAAVICIVAFDSINLMVYPPPKNFSYENTEMAKAYLFNAPGYAKLINILGLAFAGFIGGMVSAKFDKSSNKRTAWIVGGLLFVQYVINFSYIPYPVVIIVAGLALVVPATYLGYFVFVKYLKAKVTK